MDTNEILEWLAPPQSDARWESSFQFYMTTTHRPSSSEAFRTKNPKIRNTMWQSDASSDLIAAQLSDLRCLPCIADCHLNCIKSNATTAVAWLKMSRTSGQSNIRFDLLWLKLQLKSPTFMHLMLLLARTHSISPKIRSTADNDLISRSSAYWIWSPIVCATLTYIFNIHWITQSCAHRISLDLRTIFPS